MRAHSGTPARPFSIVSYTRPIPYIGMDYLPPLLPLRIRPFGRRYPLAFVALRPILTG